MPNKDGVQPELASVAKLNERLLRQRSLFEKEKAIVARQIHNDLSQNLTMLSIQFALFSQALDRQGPQVEKALIQTELQDWQNLLMQMVESVRDLVTQLRPKILDEFGIAAALEWQTNDFSRRFGASCRFVAEPEAIALCPDVSIELFRIFQGMLLYSLTFVGVRSLRVLVRAEKETINLRLDHDGKQTEVERENAAHSIAFAAFKERVQVMRGDFRTETYDGGQAMVVSIPKELSWTEQRANLDVKDSCSR